MVHTCPLNGSSPAGRKLATTSTTTGAATSPRTSSVGTKGSSISGADSCQPDSLPSGQAAGVMVAMSPLLLTDATNTSRDQWSSNYKFTPWNLTLSKG